MKCITQNLFIIIFTFVCLSACSTHNPAPVSDRSYGKQSTSRVPTASVTAGSHIVKPGETLFSIASKYGYTYKQLADINRIPPPYIIKVSQKLYIGNTPQKTQPIAKKPAAKTPVKQVETKKPAVHNRKENVTKSTSMSSAKAPDASKVAWRWPAQGQILARFTGNKGLNQGIDIGGKLGEPVLAAAQGQVVYAGSGLRGYGMLLIVKHSNVFLSAYAHNDRLRVKEGDSVKAGQVIADMGSSGTDRVKLHFEIRRNGVPVDPLQYLPRR